MGTMDYEGFMILFMVMLFAVYHVGEATKDCLNNNQLIELQNKDGRQKCQPGYVSCQNTVRNKVVCEICPDGTFQSMWTRWSSCKSRKNCDDITMHTEYVSHGNRTHNSVCKCKDGFYNDTINVRCLPHPECDRGEGTTNEGKCVVCGPGTYSDSKDNVQPCMHATRCEDLSQPRCTLKKSTNQSNTVCSEGVVQDPTRDCEDNETPTFSIHDGPTSTVNPSVSHQTPVDHSWIIGAVIGPSVTICVLIGLVAAVLYYRKRCYDNSSNETGLPLRTVEKEREKHPSAKQIVEISKTLGDNWVTLGTLLGYEEPQMHRFRAQTFNNIQQAALLMLKDAKHSFNKGKLIDSLITADISTNMVMEIFPECFHEDGETADEAC